MTPGWCEVHQLTDPCRGCAADEKAADGERGAALARQGVPRHRIRQILAEHGVPRDVREPRDDDDG